MKIYRLIFILLVSGHIKTMEPNGKNSTPQLSPLEQVFINAANTGNTGRFTDCLNRQVNCNVAAQNGYTALHTICMLGHYLLLPLALKAPGIEINKLDEEGNTPLHCAALHKASLTPQAHTLLFASLIQKGANVNAQNKQKETPLSLLLKVMGQPAQLSELLIDNGADISHSIPLPNPVNPNQPIVCETIFECAIRTNNPLHLYAFLKSTRGITKPTVLKALTLSKFGFNNGKWGQALWPTACYENHAKNNFKILGQILKRYYFTMQKLGFGTKIKDADWHRNNDSAPFPVDIAKKIAWHAAKDAFFTTFEKSCLTQLFGAPKPHAS